MRLAAFFTLIIILCLPAQAGEFRFEHYVSLSEMKLYLKNAYPKGTSADEIRADLIQSGGATKVKHPEYEGVEKYIYDINLCRLYIWRWNISADFGKDLRLTALFLNGEPVFGGSNGIRPLSQASKGEAILKGTRPRPQADLGESSLGFVAYDRDTGSRRVGDVVIVGAGPSRADPSNLGTMKMYSEVALWRSIFDADPARRIVPYSGKCQ